MTVAVETVKNVYAGTGTTGPFSYNFKIWADSDLTVIQTDENGVEDVLVLDVDYTVTGAGVSTGGTVTLTAVIPITDTLTILRDMPILQGQNWTTGTLTSASLNDSADKLDHQIQQVKEEADRSLQIPRDLSIGPLYVRPAANNLLGWDSSATGLRNYAMTTLSIPVIDHIGNYSDNLGTAITQIGSGKQILLINKAITLTANTTVPATLELWVVQGGMINSGGYTLTINGFFDAGPYQVFSGFSAGDVVFGKASIKFAYPEWFGADDIALVADSTVPLKSVILATNAVSGVEMISGKIYGTTDLSIDTTNGVPNFIRGNGATLKALLGTTKVLTFQNPQSEVGVTERREYGGFYIDGDNIATNGIYVHGMTRTHLHDIMIGKCTGYGFDSLGENGYGIYYNKCTFIASGYLNHSNGGGFRLLGWNGGVDPAYYQNDSGWDTCYAHTNKGIGWYLDRSQGTWQNCSAEKNDSYGWWIGQTTMCNLMGGWAEHNHQNYATDGTTDGTDDETFWLDSATTTIGVRIYGYKSNGKISGNITGANNWLAPSYASTGWTYYLTYDGVTLRTTADKGLRLYGTNAGISLTTTDPLINTITFKSGSNSYLASGATNFVEYDKDAAVLSALKPLAFGAITKTAKTLAATTDVTLTDAENRAFYLDIGGTSGGATNIIVTVGPKLWLAKNTSGSNITVKTAAGTGITIANGKYATLFSDGVNVIRVTPDT